MAMAKKRQCLTADCRFSAALLWIRRSSCRRNEAAFGDEVVVKTLVAGFDCYTAAPDFATASQPNAASFLRQLQEHCNCGSEPAREGRSRAGSLPQ